MSTDSVIIEHEVKQSKQSKSSILIALWRFIQPYWRSEQKLSAWFFLMGTLIFNGFFVWTLLKINHWSGHFFDTIQKVDKTAFYASLKDFVPLALTMAIFYMAKEFAKFMLEYRWRLWLSKQMIHDWLSNNVFFRMYITKSRSENPDQRIAEDLREFTEKLMNLFVNLIAQFITLVVFGVLLWKLSPPFSMLLGGMTIDIPGYMLWITLLFSLVATLITFKLGKPLVKLNYDNERIEANFRFHLMRIREYRREVSCLNSQNAENTFLKNQMIDLWGNFKSRIKYMMMVSFSLNMFSNITTVLPFVAAAPAFFAGTISLGLMYQVSNAFLQVQQAMLFFAQYVIEITALKAMFIRINGLNEEIETHTEISNSQFQLIKHNAKYIKIDNVRLFEPKQQLELAHFDFMISSQEKVMLCGKTGLGKTTLVHCIQGDWPFVSGRIECPKAMVILPQRPYFPIATLRDVLLYPELDANFSDAECQRVLTQCRLTHLHTQLQDVNDWHAKLSLGEQQCLNLARMLLQKPAGLVLDEPTSDMDKTLKVTLYQLLLAELKDSTILTISHSALLKPLHDRCIDFPSDEEK